jgi:hypothetical protein
MALACNLPPRFALITQFSHMVTSKNYFGSSHRLPALGAVRMRTTESRSYSLRDSDAFLFGDLGRNRDHQFPSRSPGAKVVLGETYELNTVGSEPFDVLEGFGDAFAD